MFIRVSINHITKSEFLIAYLAAYNMIFIEKNIKRVFRGASISFWNLNSVILKLNIHFCIFISSDYLIFGREWESQILKIK